MTKKTRWKILACVLVVLLLGWVLLNPPGRLGICTFGLTTYGCIPHPVSDIQVRCDGRTRSVEKTHDLKLEHVQWLLDPIPTVLIISTGWDGVTNTEQKIRDLKDCEVRILKTGEAVKEYNHLKKQGEKIAIHVHSTC
jgi:hypothetical protein